MNEYSTLLNRINNCDSDEVLLSELPFATFFLARIPVRKLPPSTLTSITQPLNIDQLIPTESGIYRDFRGIAELAQFSRVEIDARFLRSIDPTRSLLEALSGKFKELNNAEFSIYDLLKFIEKIERFDILDDFLPKLISFVKDYRWDSIYASDLKLLTHKDSLQESCHNPRTFSYDAFLCFVHQDLHHAEKIKVILEQRDVRCAIADEILPGHLEHDALAQMIDRSRRVIIILTPNFVESDKCEFQVKLAAEMGHELSMRKLIPVICEQVDQAKIPTTLRYLSKIDLSENGCYKWALDKLLNTIKKTD